MRIAVIHHRTRGDAVADLDALAAAANAACADGAHVIVLPAVPGLRGLAEAERSDFMARVEGCAEGAAVLVSFRAGGESGPRVVDTPLGRTALLGGDACLRIGALTALLGESLDAMVLRPAAESALQAEALLEFALGCAPALAGVVLMAECAGGSGHDGCQGASAIIHAGEVVAEATGIDDEILFAEIAVPQPAPEPSSPLPQLPPILEQRLAVHEGRQAPVDYLAELS